jgi:hypothetical protein
VAQFWLRPKAAPSTLDPQIVKISADLSDAGSAWAKMVSILICGNLRNLWMNPSVRAFVADSSKCGARLMQPIVVGQDMGRNPGTRLGSASAPARSFCGRGTRFTFGSRIARRPHSRLHWCPATAYVAIDQRFADCRWKQPGSASAPAAKSEPGHLWAPTLKTPVDSLRWMDCAALRNLPDKSRLERPALLESKSS